MRSLGGEPYAGPAVAKVPAQPGDIFFLCNADMHRFLAEEEALRTVVSAPDLAAAAEGLVAHTRPRAGTSYFPGCLLLRLGVHAAAAPSG